MLCTSHMATGEDSSEESTKVESSATPSHHDNDDNKSSDKDSGDRSGQRGHAGRKGLSSLHGEPNVYKVERQH